MPQRPKISLITVCWNSAAVIKTALDSVLAQKGVDLEYIVVDGGSSDGTVEILREYEKKSKVGFTFRYISDKDNGMYDAMNKGIKMSTGDVIGLLNADDMLACDDVLAKVAAAFEREPLLDGTYGDIRFVHSLTSTWSLDSVRSERTLRYCSGKRFRPWMFRFGTQTAHPSTFSAAPVSIVGVFSSNGETVNRL